MLKVWDTLQGVMILGIVATIYVVHGQLKNPTEDIEQALSSHELCMGTLGQYDLKYYEAGSASTTVCK